MIIELGYVNIKRAFTALERIVTSSKLDFSKVENVPFQSRKRTFPKSKTYLSKVENVTFPKSKTFSKVENVTFPKSKTFSKVENVKLYFSVNQLVINVKKTSLL